MCPPNLSSCFRSCGFVTCIMAGVACCGVDPFQRLFLCGSDKIRYEKKKLGAGRAGIRAYAVPTIYYSSVYFIKKESEPCGYLVEWVSL